MYLLNKPQVPSIAGHCCFHIKEIRRHESPPPLAFNQNTARVLSEWASFVCCVANWGEQDKTFPSSSSVTSSIARLESNDSQSLQWNIFLHVYQQFLCIQSSIVMLWRWGTPAWWPTRGCLLYIWLPPAFRCTEMRVIVIDRGKREKMNKRRVEKRKKYQTKFTFKLNKQKYFILCKYKIIMHHFTLYHSNSVNDKKSKVFAGVILPHLPPVKKISFWFDICSGDCDWLTRPAQVVQMQP